MGSCSKQLSLLSSGRHARAVLLSFVPLTFIAILMIIKMLVQFDMPRLSKTH
jgi:hypothetical protein